MKARLVKIWVTPLLDDNQASEDRVTPSKDVSQVGTGMSNTLNLRQTKLVKIGLLHQWMLAKLVQAWVTLLMDDNQASED